MIAQVDVIVRTVDFLSRHRMKGDMNMGMDWNSMSMMQDPCPMSMNFPMMDCGGGDYGGSSFGGGYGGNQGGNGGYGGGNGGFRGGNGGNGGY